MTTTTTIALIACGLVLLVQMVIIVVTSLQVSAAIKQIGTCKCNKKSNRGPVFMGPSGRKGQFRKSMPFGNSPKITRERKPGGIH